MKKCPALLPRGRPHFGGDRPESILVEAWRVRERRGKRADDSAGAFAGQLRADGVNRQRGARIEIEQERQTAGHLIESID